MRIKKGFTLAEVLIVLMVIGAIATMTIPSLMKGVTETQWKTAYKKAYNAVINLTAMERIAGSLPSTADATGVGLMFQSLQSNLSAKDYTSQTNSAVNSGTVATTAQLQTGITFTDSNGNTVSAGDANDAVDFTAGGETSPWINTDDGLSYMVTKGTTCGTKSGIDSAADLAAALSNSCVVVIVDVNGVNKGPNIIEPQMTAGIGAAESMDTLTGDQYYIFVGRDGATAGSKKVTVTGRIVGDLK